jgi:hypothetical protein
VSQVAENVRVLMAKNKWRGVQVAKWMGIRPSALSRKLSGDVPFTLPNIVDLHTNSGVPYSDILASKEAQN